MLLSLAQSVDANAFVKTMREIAWVGAMINVMHLVALAVFFGALLIVDLRLLGTGLTREPLAEVADQARPWLIGGFVGLVLTGIPQLALQPLKEYYSDLFNMKMQIMLVAIVFTFIVRARITHADEAGLGPFLPKLVAVASIGLWLAEANPARLSGLVG
jgi:putative copper export protein